MEKSLAIIMWNQESCILHPPHLLYDLGKVTSPTHNFLIWKIRVIMHRCMRALPHSVCVALAVLLWRHPNWKALTCGILTTLLKQLLISEHGPRDQATLLSIAHVYHRVGKLSAKGSVLNLVSEAHMVFVTSIQVCYHRAKAATDK